MSARKQKPITEQPIDTNATSTIVAFTFQFERALFRLFSSYQADIQVGVETLDDVAELFANADGSISAKLEQDANTVQAGKQPFQDSSRKLWHTLRVWLSHLSELRMKYAEVTFCAVTNAKVPQNSLIQALSAARTAQEIKDAVKLLKEKAVEILASETSSAAVDAREVTKYSVADLSFLVQRLLLLHKGGTKADVQPREATIGLFQLHSRIASQGHEIYASILGMMVDRCQQAWRNDEPAWFSPQIFRDRLSDEITRRSLDRYLDRPMVSTNFKDFVAGGGRDHYFLSQLTRLNLPDDFVDKHLDMFWAYRIERSRLEEEGVTHREWDARAGELHQRWDVCRGNVAVELIDKPDASPDWQGRRTLVATLDQNYKAPLGNNATKHLYLTHGHYHQLANDRKDKYFVYWHPALKQSGNSEEQEDE